MSYLVFALLLSSVSASDTVRVVKDIDYVEGADYADGKDRLDLYLPEGASDAPVLVFFHGGGLRSGDKSASEHVGMALASAGYAAAIVNYRLSPSVEHPAHAEDAARSIAWVYRNIDAYGGNANALYLSGHSAGAYLAALLTLDDRYLEKEGLSTKIIRASMPISGFFFVDLVAPDRPKDVWGEDASVWKEASPAGYVRADAPPLLLLYADGDDAWRRQQNEDLAKALQKKGHADVDTVQISARDHRGIWTSISPDDETLDAMLAFMKSH